ncbi:nuclear protein [Cryptococcus neoformans C23]|uniref:Nuclear protein n=1 Tax=Cryptococcus neoformans (strain H99 / ATCC 208821 / CBS 10515 / FGSC 9487) TaxID=235443 RepID=J9VNS6_CRYN9|nr:nuclear protein [Cryptococcus neoformans var. grubii H99]AUB22884.1 nuclear protein [Cryptococcus neoformans var. grubii]OWZ34746.1 nuclear protein [Cryptococcus neoformans var. grubii AD2-60a]OWZ46845.1 nuclear protein [Cryptococcus neoformans var. grubii C23]OXC86338.1 nuclear protein [Cryptococcus neoformans var. grubii AD1-7a]AFR93350.1 nuclear protein [Cryptococcus neoformans var. grubii H99]|eukprot:XP_012047496.1 nuclear protein [Cryptococcus neoformans var. grubii H99]
MSDIDGKRRKVQRACDVCRRKKIKCEGPMNSLSDAKCAHCEEYDMDCTYVEAAKRRGPPKGYVETLEQRAGRLERMLQQIYPGVDLNEYVGPKPDREDFDINSYHGTLRSLNIPPYPALKPLHSEHLVTPHTSRSTSVGTSPAAAAPSPSMQALGPSPWRMYERDPARPAENESDVEEEAAAQLSIATSMSQLDVRDSHWRWHGRASGAFLMRQFEDLRSATGDTSNIIQDINNHKRQQFWHVPEWELVIANEGLRPLDYSIWPEKGFDQQLINAYFDNVNLHLPLLNRKFFQRQYDSGMWRNNPGFSRVCLLVFANGSRFVDDPRVYWPTDLSMTEEGRERLATDKDGTLRYSAGWKYLRILLRMGRSIMQGPNLYEFQSHVLICQFLQGSAVPHLMWILSGFGLRSAQELGIHVRATLLHADPTERALYNRAFWCLYHIDRYNCAAIGRSVAIQDTDFNADYPIEVDDEYWDTGDAERNFKQPEGKISSIASFVQTLKLDHIVGAILQTVYAINKLPEQRADIVAQRAIVVELDSALNSWADNVPHELRWDPSRSNYQLFRQSAVLYIYYYYCQILIHRPFIPGPRNQHAADLPSLAVCVNAARSICNITDAALKRGRQEGCLPGRALNVSFMLPTWIAAIILLINIYSGRQTVAEREKALIDIRRCVAASKELEVIWRQSGKYTDFLLQLARESGMPHADKVPMVEKRLRDGNPQPSERSRRPEPMQGSSTAGTPDHNSPSTSYPYRQDRSNVQNSRSSGEQSGQPSAATPVTGFDLCNFTSPETYGDTSATTPQFPYSRGDLPFTHMPSPSTSQTGFQNMFQPPSQSSQYPSNTSNVPPPHFVSPSQVHTTQQYNFQTPNEQQHLPLRNDGQLASSNIYDSLIDMTSFESQLLDMSTTAFGGQENTSNGDWWSRLFSDYMGPDLHTNMSSAGGPSSNS